MENDMDISEDLLAQEGQDVIDLVSEDEQEEVAAPRAPKVLPPPPRPSPRRIYHFVLIELMLKINYRF